MNIQSITELNTLQNAISNIQAETWLEVSYNNTSYKYDLRKFIDYVNELTTNLQKQINDLSNNVSVLNERTTSAENNFGKYLPLTGGTLSGPLTINTYAFNDNVSFDILGIMNVERTKVNLANNVKLYGIATSAQWC